MHILFITENFPPETNASAARVYERACYWVKWGHDVTIITCTPNFPEGEVYPGYTNRWYQTETMDGLRIVRVKTFMAANKGTVRRTLDFLSFMISSTIAGLFERRPDVIVATSPQFFAAVGGWILGAIRRIPFVFELGDLWPASIVAVGAMRPNLGIRLLEKLELFLYRHSVAVVALTNAFKSNLVKRGINKNKISVIINGVDAWRYGPRAADPALLTQTSLHEKFVVGYVGTHGMAHALNNVLDAAEILRKSEEISFLFAGGGADRDNLINDARSRALTNLVFLDRQPKEKMPAVWSLCSVALVHLRNSEVFRDVIPSKMFEAMAMGLPILLAAPEGEASEILRQNNAGLHVPPEMPSALADAIQCLSSDSALYTKFASNSLAAGAIHSRESQAHEMLKVLEKSARG
ncbi:MAG: glycosyltransferase WbuB [Magnetovibrio sp.]|nr:glycosyltransferase WbuB [Magnetovibrio sp.]